MSADLDRFDRMLLGLTPASPTRATYRTTAASFHARATAGTPKYTAPEHEPTVITSTRGPRFVDHTACPMCGIDRLGIEYHGELRDGTKVHQLATHAPGMRRGDNGKGKCLGAGIRIEFVGGEWRGVRP